MKRRNLLLAFAAVGMVLGLWVWQRSPAPTPQPTMLSLGVGQRFEEVVNASTYPVMQRSAVPEAETGMAGVTAVTEPAVILCFNDPEHGFTLPPTKFALVGYTHNVVATVSTSPMPEKPFDQAIAVLENLQNQSKAGGWEPWGKKRLYQRMFKPGFSQSAELRVPRKYSVTFPLKCTDGCWPGEKPPYLFLIDIGVGSDTFGWERGDPEVWDNSFRGNVASTAPARFRCDTAPGKETALPAQH